VEIRLEGKAPAAVEADAIVVLAFEGTPPLGQAASELYAAGEIKGESCETAIVHHPTGYQAKRLVLVGAGKPEKFSPPEMRKVVGAALRALKPKGVRSICLVLDEPYRGDDFTSAAVEGALLADFEPDQHKTDPKKSEKKVDVFAVAGGSEAGLKRGRILGESQNFTRGLINEPANILTPSVMAGRAKEMAAASGLECEVLDQAKMTELGMGALLGVSQGSAEPPAFIIVRYKPQKAASKDHLALIGKGVTFDTGGVSIKPSDGMEKMKYDMSGGAAVLGAMRAIAQLKPSVTITAIVPAVENMVGSRAQRPGDIVKTLNGKTVEVLNTDAEGRLILVDAITYAQRLGCTHMVDIATLTGSIVVALGHERMGAFTNDEALLGKVLAATKAEGEKTWQMPMDEEYKEGIKSPFADLQNIGGRPAGSITAAWFLNEFTDGKPWVHLDIAGTAWNDDVKPFLAKGPVGVCVRSFVRLAENWA
jgi:leucyl aminopeptidase